MKGTLRYTKESFYASLFLDIGICVMMWIAASAAPNSFLLFMGIVFLLPCVLATAALAVQVYGSSIVFSEKDRGFTAEKFFRRKRYSIAEITAIQVKEIRTTNPPSFRGNKPAHDGEIRTLILHCRKEKIRVSRKLDSSGVFEQFLRKMTAPEIWMETKRIRVWNPLDIFLSSEDDPWEQMRKNAKN